MYNKITGYRVMLNIIPEETERIRQMMEDFGLNPDDNREDHSTPVGMGTAINHVDIKECGGRVLQMSTYRREQNFTHPISKALQ